MLKNKPEKKNFGIKALISSHNSSKKRRKERKTLRSES